MFLAWALIKPGTHALFIAVIDCALAVGPLSMALVAFSWYFILGPTMLQGDGTTFAKLVGVGYPSSDLLMIFCLLRLAFRSSDADLRLAIHLLSFSLLIMVLTDCIYDYLTLQGLYGTNGLLEVGWSVGFMLLGLAVQAMLLVRQKASVATSSSQASTSEATSDMLSMWRSLLPYAFVPAVGLLAVYI